MRESEPAPAEVRYNRAPAEDRPMALTIVCPNPRCATRLTVGDDRAGETFEMAGLRTLIGRSPDCHVFLDDVTVSRRHAEIVHENDDYVIRDLGSLNGTFVNRRRIESSVLAADDEVQIGKYRMTFLLP